MITGQEHRRTGALGHAVKGPVGIVIATRFEAAPILKAFHFRQKEKNIYEAASNGTQMYLAICGAGIEPARRAAHKLCDLGAKELISAGFCGALSESLKAGDLVTDRIATVAKPVLTQGDRRALSEKAGAQAADMETQAVVEAGTRRGVPIHMLRVVSDTFDDDLSELIGPTEHFSRWRIALRLWNPKLWPLALRLRRQSKVAHQRLVQALIEYLK